jgi:GDP-L-fucose synthase
MLSHINVGTGKEVIIRELVQIMKKMAGFEGKIIFDKVRPDRAPRKLIDVSLIFKMGWKYSVDLED